LLNISGPIKSIKSGIGLSVYLDELGPQNSTAARLHYAYQLKLGGATKLGLGVSLGMINSSINSDWVAYDFNDDGMSTGIGSGIGDQSIPQNQPSVTAFDASFGVYLPLRT
jgi:hypothetical protein